MALKYGETFYGMSTTLATFRQQFNSRADGSFLTEGTANMLFRAGRFSGTVGSSTSSSAGGTSDSGNSMMTHELSISGTLLRFAIDVFCDTGSESEVKHLASVGNTGVGRFASTGTALVNNANTFFGLVRNTDFTVSLQVGSLVQGTSVTTLPNGGYYRLEVEADIKAAGSCKVYLAGNPTPIIDFSGNVTNGIASLAGLRVAVGASPVYVSTIFVWDDQDVGDGFKGYLGDFEPRPIFPNGAGASSMSTPVGAATRHEAVDDTFRNGATDYVVLANNGDKDLYTHTPVGTTGTVVALLLQSSAFLGGNGFAKSKLEVRSGGVNASSADSRALANLGEEFPILTQMAAFGTDPNTGVAWTVAGIDACEIGVSAVIP